MKSFNHIISVVLALVLVICACERKDLVEEEIYASMTILSEEPVPEDALFRAVVYDRADGHKIGYSFTGPEGGQVQVGAGLRAVLVHSFGCETAVVEGEEDWPSAYVTATRGDAIQQALWTKALSMHPVYGDSAVVGQRHAAWAKMNVSWEPDAMFVGTTDSLVVPRREIGDEYLLDVSLRPVRKMLDIILSDVEGMEWAASASVLLAGCAAGVDLSTGSALGSPTVVSASLYRYGGSLRGQLVSFGDCPGTEPWLVVVLTDIAGESFSYEYPLSSAVGSVNAPSRIVIEKPDVEEGGGLQPTLEDWHEIEIPVNL